MNLFYTQLFINHNIPHGQGWYLVSARIITADAGQVFNAQVEAFYNVLRAGPGSISTPGDWQFRFELALLFPE